MTFAQWFTQAATVETYTGPGEFGDEYAAPVDVLGLLSDGTTLVRGPSGDMLVASTAFYTDLAHEALFRPESRVTINGRPMQVDSCMPRRAAPIFHSLEHLEVHLK